MLQVNVAGCDLDGLAMVVHVSVGFDVMRICGSSVLMNEKGYSVYAIFNLVGDRFRLIDLWLCLISLLDFVLGLIICMLSLCYRIYDNMLGLRTLFKF